LWRRSVIDEHRRKLHEIPELQRIVVAIDPAVSSEDDSNETGIIAAGLGADGDGYVRRLPESKRWRPDKALHELSTELTPGIMSGPPPFFVVDADSHVARHLTSSYSQ
jgi:hypothetical protein